MKFNIESFNYLNIENYKEHIENVLNIFNARFTFFSKMRSFFHNVKVDNLHYRLTSVMLTFEQLSQIYEDNSNVMQEDLKEIYDATQLFWNGFYTYELTKNKTYGMYLMYRGTLVLKDKMSSSVNYYLEKNKDEMLWNYKIVRLQEICSEVNVEYGKNLFFQKYVKEVRFPNLIYFQQKKKKSGILSEISRESLKFARNQARKIVNKYNPSSVDSTISSTRDFLKNFLAERNKRYTKVEINFPELKEMFKTSSNVEKINIVEQQLNNVLRGFSSTELVNKKVNLLKGLKSLNALKDITQNNDVIINHEVNNIFGNNLLNLLDIIYKTNHSNINLLIENCALNNILIERLIITYEDDINNMMKVKNNILKEKIQNF